MLKHQKAILSLALSQIILWSGLYYIFPALLLKFEQHYGWSRSELTLALAIAVAVSALFAPVAGRLIDAGYGRHLMVGSGVLGALSLLVASLVTSLPLFYLCWAAIGVAMAGSLYEPCFAVVIRYMGDQAAKAIALIALVAGFASTVTFPSAIFFAENFGLAATLQLFAALILLIGVPANMYGTFALRKASQTRHEFHRQPSSTTKWFLSAPAFWLLALSFAFLGLTQGVILNHLLPIMEQRGVSQSDSVVLLSCIGPMQFLGRLLWGLYAEKIAAKTMLSLCFIGGIVSLLILLIAGHSVVLLAVYIFIQGFFFGIFNIIKPLVTRDIMGEKDFASIAGMLALPYLMAFAVAPLVGAGVWQSYGYSVLLSALAVGLVMGLMLYQLSMSHRFVAVKSK